MVEPGLGILWQLKRTSPFHGYTDQELTTTPSGLTLREFMEIYADEATPDEWIHLASAFLSEMEADEDGDQ